MAAAGLLWFTPFTYFYEKQLRKSPSLLNVRHTKQCHSSHLRTLTAWVSTQFRQVGVVSASLVTCTQRDYTMERIDKEKQPDKTIPDCSWSTASLSEPEWLWKEERSVTYRGNPTAQFSSLLPYFGKARKFFSAQRDWRHMGCCFLHPRCTAWTHGCWKVINPFFGMRTMGCRNLLGNFPNISRNVPECAKRTEADHQRFGPDTDPFRLQPCRLKGNYLTKSFIYYESIIRNMLSCCRESFQTFECEKEARASDRLYLSNLLIWLD